MYKISDHHALEIWGGKKTGGRATNMGGALDIWGAH
jgi:hypothetical protein